MTAPIAIKAVVIAGKGGVETLSLANRTLRAPGPGELLVEVAAASCNRADIVQRRGFYAAPAGAVQDIPGLEYAGTVAQVGDGVQRYKAGDRVMGIVAGGAMATHVMVHEREAMPVPKNLSLTDAGAIPEVFLTAYDALFLQAGLKTGETMLVHAVGSGIGTAAIQLARAISATSVGTSRTADKLERCAKLGLDIGIAVPEKTFAKAVLEKTGGRGADVILDTVGAGYLGENVSALAPRGRIITIGLLAGVAGELPLGALLAKRASITGSVLRSRPLEEKAALAQAATAALVPLFERGALVPVIDKVMPMSEIRAAHEYLESNQSFGKLVMTWS
jgi:putative PIG3 family NAD(P)H quinone oxidoreductase